MRKRSGIGDVSGSDRDLKGGRVKERVRVMEGDESKGKMNWGCW